MNWVDWIQQGLLVGSIVWCVAAIVLIVYVRRHRVDG
jgi:hypothetical protein